MSARHHIYLASGLLIAALGAPVAALEAPAPQSSVAAVSPGTATAETDEKPTDEAATALKASEEGHSDGVAAKVNDTPITNYDVRQRMSLFVATSGVRPTPEAMKEIRGQVLKQLETERMELLEATKNKVSVSAADVDKAIADIMTDNHLSAEQLNKLLSGADVRMETLRAQIAAQIAWSKLVQDALGDRVHVSQLDVDDELGRLKRSANKPHYSVAEIFQAVDTPEQDAKVKKDMENLETQLQAGAPFSAVARQLSQNPTAAQGGDLGTVIEGQLPPELDKALKAMHTGEISPPIRATGGYYILFLRAVQLPAGSAELQTAAEPTGPVTKLSLARILLPIGPSPKKELVERAVQAAGVMRSQIQSCAGAKEISSRLPGSIYMSLPDMRIADLSAEMQTAINQTEPGGVTSPMVSAAGVEIIVRCDKRRPKVEAIQLPSRDRVEQQIYEEQITTLARQYLRDLRRDASVETVEK
ncbi:MAG TPA: peptidylprolyl isomerase [Rhizomicrobium sp.]|nr:peptidylprolyl isomerase [Rhizomicrobium sp.]